MHVPQVIYLCIAGVSVIIALFRDGNEKVGTYRAGEDIIFLGFGLSLLYWGGFFSH